RPALGGRGVDAGLERRLDVLRLVLVDLAAQRDQAAAARRRCHAWGTGLRPDGVSGPPGCCIRPAGANNGNRAGRGGVQREGRYDPPLRRSSDRVSTWEEAAMRTLAGCLCAVLWLAPASGADLGGLVKD